MENVLYEGKFAKILGIKPAHRLLTVPITPFPAQKNYVYE
jgi:hypothetical protein